MKTPRYLVDFDSRKLERKIYDVVIIGSGIAGVYTALCLPDNIRIAILTKEEINISNSVLAQGGIAVSLGKEDSPELHFRDTIAAGAGLCDEEAVRILVNNAGENINRLCNYGVRFDKEKEGSLSLSREAAHSIGRIVHAGDATGKEVCDTLITVVKKKKNVEIFEEIMAVDFLTENDQCEGVLVLQDEKLVMYLSPVVVCAAGGYGQLYRNTTNPEVATGDGAAMAYRAGVELMDMEFVQFHPTVLYHPENRSFLISEAVRGEGAILRNIKGERFMPLYHELAELAPRDVVSRAIFNEMRNTKAEHVCLDITFKDKEYLQARFPNIFKTCFEYGIDISKDYIPVAPAEHYCMGGIKTDAFGRTNIKGLFACGEAACNGIHGANRLASNSLLEGLVFGRNIAEQVGKICSTGKQGEFEQSYRTEGADIEVDVDTVKKGIQDTMQDEVGIIRDRQGLMAAMKRIREYMDRIAGIWGIDAGCLELQNMILVSYLVINSAIEREESRGAHFRRDFPLANDLKWKENIVVRKEGNNNAGEFNS